MHVTLTLATVIVRQVIDGEERVAGDAYDESNKAYTYGTHYP